MASPAGSSGGSRPEAEQAVTPSEMARPARLRVASRDGGGRYPGQDGEAGASEGAAAVPWPPLLGPRWRGRHV